MENCDDYTKTSIIYRLEDIIYWLELPTFHSGEGGKQAKQNKFKGTLLIGMGKPSAQFQFFLHINNCFDYYTWLAHSDKPTF